MSCHQITQRPGDGRGGHEHARRQAVVGRELLDVQAGAAAQQKPGGGVPRLHAVLVVGVEAPGGRPGEVEGGAARAANVAHPREILQPVLLHSAYGFVLVHNHPSGDPSPSEPDIALTREIYQAGRLLDIDLLDHVIIGQGSYCSMKELRLGFPS